MSEPDWLRLQKKIFTRYVQQTLRSAGSKTVVNDLVNDLSSGALLIEILEILSGKEFPGKKPGAAKARPQQIDNNLQALKFARETCGVTTQLSAEQLVDANQGSNVNLVLGTIFQIILKFMKIEDEEGNPAGDVKVALLLWWKNKTAGYAGVNVENFTKSFHDGLAFNALINRMRPKLVDFAALSGENKIPNLQQALEIGDKYCNVEKYLEASDIAKLDEVSMIVYLSDWYYGASLLQKQDVAAKRVGKLIAMTELHDKMRADYKAGAAAFNAWADGKIAELNDRNFDGTLAGIQGRLQKFYDYKNTEKTAKLGDEMDLESLFANLSLRLHNVQRPPFNPGDNLTVTALQKKIQDLEKAETDASAAGHAELKRQLRLHATAKRFKAVAETVKAYITAKIAYFNAAESISLVEHAEIALEQHAVELTETQQAKDTRMKELSDICAQLAGEKFENQSQIAAIESELRGLFDKGLAAAATKKATLDAALKQQQDLNDQACREFADASKKFVDWVSAKKNALGEKSTDELEKQLADLNASSADHGNADGMLAAIAAAADKVKAREVTDNPHTQVSTDDCRSMWKMFGMQFEKKKELLTQQIEDKKKGGLTPEQLKEIEDNFKYFDKNKSGKIDRKELRACLQSLGEDATPKAIDAVLSQWDKGGKGELSFADFSEYMKTKLGDTNSKDEIIQSFKYISFDKDYVTVVWLSNLVNDLSWKDHHVDYLKKECKPKDDGLDYGTWTEEVFAR